MGNDVDRFLAAYAPDIRDLSQQLRALIASVVPDADENLKPGWKVIWYGFGTKMPVQFAVVMPTRNHVGLGFAHGSELPDPGRRLEGTGKRIRHVKLGTAADVSDPAIAALLRAQVARTRAEAAAAPSVRASRARTLRGRGKVKGPAKGTGRRRPTARGPASRAASPRRKRASSR